MCLQLGALVAAPLHNPAWPWSPPPLTAPSGGFLGAPHVPHPAVRTSIPQHSSTWVSLAHTERFSWEFLQVSSAYVLPLALALNLMSPRPPSGAEYCLGRGTQGSHSWCSMARAGGSSSAVTAAGRMLGCSTGERCVPRLTVHTWRGRFEVSSFARAVLAKLFSLPRCQGCAGPLLCRGLGWLLVQRLL